MSLPTPEELNPMLLPSCGMDKLEELPLQAGIYFLLRDQEILYIGRASCIRHRWKSHHVFPKILPFVMSLRITWLLADDQTLLPQIEQAMIHYWRPCLNGTHCSKEPKRLSTTKLASLTTTGGRLRALRLGHGYTQNRLAQAAGISQGLIARIENNNVHEPATSVVLKLARALGCSMDYLAGLYDEDPTAALVLTVAP